MDYKEAIKILEEAKVTKKKDRNFLKLVLSGVQAEGKLEGFKQYKSLAGGTPNYEVAIDRKEK